MSIQTVRSAQMLVSINSSNTQTDANTYTAKGNETTNCSTHCLTYCDPCMVSRTEMRKNSNDLIANLHNLNC